VKAVWGTGLQPKQDVRHGPGMAELVQVDNPVLVQVLQRRIAKCRLLSQFRPMDDAARGQGADSDRPKMAQQQGHSASPSPSTGHTTPTDQKSLSQSPDIKTTVIGDDRHHSQRRGQKGGNRGERVGIIPAP
jgi:hypothetical protein